MVRGVSGGGLAVHLAENRISPPSERGLAAPAQADLKHIQHFHLEQMELWY